MRIGDGDGLADEPGPLAEPPQAAATTTIEVATAAAAIARRAVHLLKRVLSTTTEPTHGSAERAPLHPGRGAGTCGEGEWRARQDANLRPSVP